MATKEEFIQDLKNEDTTDEELVEKYICFGTPVIFNDQEHKYYNLKKTSHCNSRCGAKIILLWWVQQSLDLV